MKQDSPEDRLKTDGDGAEALSDGSSFHGLAS